MLSEPIVLLKVPPPQRSKALPPHFRPHNMKSPSSHPLVRLALVSMLATSIATAADFLWQEEHATVLPTGDIQWNPQPFVFTTSGTVYYIDYEAGSDSNNGTSPTSPWKHHPWDADATGNPAAASGPHTYLFKRGVTYRGQLKASESGLPDQPIRLTSDPNWGAGKARLSNAERITTPWIRVNESGFTPPARLPELEHVWATDLSGADWIDNNGEVIARMPDGGITWQNNGIVPTAEIGLFLVDENDTGHRLHMARSPNWQPMSENFAMEYWHITDNQVATYYPEAESTLGGPTDSDLIGLPQDYFTGGISWFMYQDLMGTPIARNIPATRTVNGVEIPFFNPDTGTFLQNLPWGLDAGGRYMIENLPQFLDTTGEYYFDKATQILYYRPGEGIDPNNLRLEMTAARDFLSINNESHIHVSGLDFEFIAFDAISVSGDMEDIKIHHNNFRHITKRGIYTKQRITNVAAHGPKDDILSNYEISDNYFEEVWANAIVVEDGHAYSLVYPYGRIHDLRILRNRTYYTGERANITIQSAVPAIHVVGPREAHVAGNIIERSFGSGILVYGGSTSGLSVPDFPYNRILVYQNKTQDTALGVNDYGGLSLWMGGPIFSFNNNIGNATGHMAAGFRTSSVPRNLSYPYYIDGGYKQYGFNNIVWNRTTNPQDPYRSTESAYFNVFGFLNQFFNNTIYRHRDGIGGSTGHRNDHIGNIFAEISNGFLQADRSGNPSLIGGGDDGSSALRGIPTLGFGHNAFHGDAGAGRLITASAYDGENEIVSPYVEVMAQQMEAFPIRYPHFGERSDTAVIFGSSNDPMEDTSEADFRHTASPQVLDAAGTYFVPWGLRGVVGEWNFTENHADPTQLVDFGFYLSEAHFERMMFEFIPYFTLKANHATLADYVPAHHEDWTNGAFRFDGTNYATYPDAKMREEIAVPLEGRSDWVNRASKNPNWVADEPSGPDGAYTSDDYLRFPGHLRKTPAISTENLLVEATLKVVPATTGTIVSKHDGESGYRLFINAQGHAEMEISSAGEHFSVATSTPIDDDTWQHVIVELQRADLGQSNGRLTLYHNGQLDTQISNLPLSTEDSLDNPADLVVGARNTGSGFTDYLQADLDFLRLAHHTLAAANTSIEELWAWQSDGPWKRDMRGNLPVNKRDAGALEAIEPIAPSSLPLTVYVDGSVTLYWQDNSAVETGYRIERSTSADFSTDLVTFAVAADTEVFYDGTVNIHNRTYYYRLFAVYGEDTSLPSASLPSTGNAVVGFTTSGMSLNGPVGREGSILNPIIAAADASHGPGINQNQNGWSNTISSTGFDTDNEAQAAADEEFIRFTVTPAEGEILKYERITLDLWTQNDNPGYFFLRSPLTGETNLGIWEYTAQQTVSADLASFPAFKAVEGPVEFHLYFYHTQTRYGARGIMPLGEDIYALTIDALSVQPPPIDLDPWVQMQYNHTSVNLVFPTMPGVPYQIESADSPEGPYFPVEESPQAMGDGSNQSLTVPMPTDGSKYYRIRYIEE